jgi:hypothetical protein
VRAALSAVSEDWALLVVDPGSPHTALIPRPAVWAIAQQQPWVPAVSNGSVDPEIDAINPGLSRIELNSVLARVNQALGASTLISARVDSLELRVGRA